MGNRWVGISPRSQSSQSQQYTSFKKVLFQIEQENLSLSVSQCSSFRREHNNILPPKFPKFPATQGALPISDTVWGIGGLVSPHDLRVHNHNNILVLKRFYFKLNKKISLSLSVSQCSSFRREHNNILPPKFPKFPATQVP